MPFLILVLPAFLGMDLTLSVRYLLRPSSYRSRRAALRCELRLSLDNWSDQPSTARIQQGPLGPSCNQSICRASKISRRFRTSKAVRMYRRSVHLGKDQGFHQLQAHVLGLPRRLLFDEILPRLLNSENRSVVIGCPAGISRTSDLLRTLSPS